MSDALDIDRLVVMAQGGDADAFRQLFFATQKEVFTFLCARSPNPSLAEEILQSTFVIAWEKLDRYEPRGLFIGWLKTIAHNQLRQELRRMRRHVEVDHDSLQDVLLRASESDCERTEDESKALAHCLEELPTHARELLQHRYLHNRGIDEMAAEMGRKASTLAVTLFRLRTALRQCLDRMTVHS